MDTEEQCSIFIRKKENILVLYSDVNLCYNKEIRASYIKKSVYVLKSKPKFIFIKAVFEMEKCLAPLKGSKQMDTDLKPFSCAQVQDPL